MKIYLNRKGPLTWNGSFKYVVVNPHPCWFLAQSQLPHLRFLPGHNARPLCPLFPPIQAILSIQMTLTCLNLCLWGTITVFLVSFLRLNEGIFLCLSVCISVLFLTLHECIIVFLSLMHYSIFIILLFGASLHLSSSFFRASLHLYCFLFLVHHCTFLY
jgi:hypothetical protein